MSYSRGGRERSKSALLTEEKKIKNATSPSTSTWEKLCNQLSFSSPSILGRNDEQVSLITKKEPKKTYHSDLLLTADDEVNPIFKESEREKDEPRNREKHPINASQPPSDYTLPRAKASPSLRLSDTSETPSKGEWNRMGLQDMNRPGIQMGFLGNGLPRTQDRPTSKLSGPEATTPSPKRN